MRVALVVMPFAAADRPSLAVGLLKASLQEAGISCDVKHFNLTLHRLLGAEPYRALSHDSPMTALAGEWVFSQLLYGDELSDWESYRREVLDDPIWRTGDDHRRAIRDALDLAPTFLRVAFESTDWSRYDLVGFTSTFEQTMASLCLAREIRRRHPEIHLAMGGANFESGMGRPYLEHYDFLDFIATGEADRAFPELCQRLAEARESHGEISLKVPHGFLYREGGEVRYSSPGQEQVFVRLDDLPFPDYDEYFEILARGGGPRPDDPDEMPWLPVEASRGCWWGQKAHCTFCGLNGERMAFRRKTWRRVVEETDALLERYGEHPLHFADNILDMSYFGDLLPFWAEREDGHERFVEVKSNLRRHHVELLRDAGVFSLQPGIESLSDRTLKVMRKGVSGAQNVALLRWCAELGVEAVWNVLYGFPHEELEDFDTLLEVLRKMTHLPPPVACSLIRMDRFSPNFAQWREQGFTRLEPLPAYRHVFPFPPEARAEMAYYFDYDHPQKEAARRAGRAIQRFGHEWREHRKRGECGELAVRPHWQGGFVLMDRRFNFAADSRRLTAAELALLLACDAPTTRARVLEHHPQEAPLEEFLDRGWIVELGGRLVALPLLPSPRSVEEVQPGLPEPSSPPVARAA